MELAEFRKHASELSGGTSGDAVKNLVIRCLTEAGSQGELLDFGAGRGDLLRRLQALGGHQKLAGADLFPRPTNLDEAIGWYQQDLNLPLTIAHSFDSVVCSETIEHLENPRQTFRSLRALLRPNGLLVMTMPNQECLRSYVGLLAGGHFTHFLGASYPAHITALLRLDLTRICRETGFSDPSFSFSDEGGIPKLPSVLWQSATFGLARGRLFSDNIAAVARRVD